jgi:hypothetical protein
MKNQIIKNIFFALLAVPVNQLESWKMEVYSSIPANKATVEAQSLQIKVQKSASPLIYPLKNEVKVSAFKIAGEFKSLPIFKDVTRQGEKGFDDFPLRLGIIVPGEKKLSGLKRLFAPSWVKNLYRQLPEGQGLDHISFFDVTQNPQLVGTSRVHPSSELIMESFIHLVKSPGPFEISYTLKKPISAAAIWLSVDGDDTQSEFTVIVSKIELQTEE